MLSHACHSPCAFPPSHIPGRLLPLIRGGSVPLEDALLLYLFNEGSGDDVINHGVLAPEGTVDAGAIAYSSQGAKISGSAGTGSITERVLTRASIYWTFKWDPADGTAEAALFANPANEILLTVRQNPNVPKFKFGSAVAAASFSDLRDNKWHIIAGIYDGTKATLWLDGVKIAEDTEPGQTATLTNLVVGAFNNGGFLFPSTHGIGAVFGEAHSAGQQKSVCRQIRAVMEERGASFAATHALIKEGDSITASANLQLMEILGPVFPVSRNFAVGGSTISHKFTSDTPTLMERRAQVIEMIQQAAESTVVVMIGANDLATIGATAYMAQLQTYCEALRAGGATYIVVATPTPRTDATWTTQRNLLLPLLYAAEGTFFDKIVDHARDAYIGPNAAAADTTWFSDGTHTQDAADLRIARNDLSAVRTVHGVAVDILSEFEPDHFLHAIDSTLTPRTDGVGIDTWEDLGSAGEDGIGQPSHKPTYDADGINGGPSIAFNGDQAFYHSFAIGGSTGAATFVWVVAANTQTGFRGIYSTHAVGTDHKEAVFGARILSNFWGAFSGAGHNALSDIQGDGPLVLGAIRTGLPGRFYNNLADDGPFTDAIGQNQGHIGGLYGANQALSGKMGAVFAKRDVLTPEEFRRLCTKLGDDFGIAL